MKLRSRNHMEPYLLDKYTPYQGGSAIKSGVRLPGTSGNYLSSADSVLNSITGDIDIRVYAKLDDWTPASLQGFVSKRDTNQTSYEFRGNVASGLELAFSTNGTAIDHSVTTGLLPPFADGTAGWVRATLDVDNGAGGNDVKFYYSTDGITWTQLGATVTTAGVVSIFRGTAPLRIGVRDSAGNTDNLAGTIYYAEVRNGIDGPVVAKFDASQVAVSGAQSPATINGWTWNGSALYKRDDYVRLPGTSGNYLTYPDTPATRITGDIDIRVKLNNRNTAKAFTPFVAKINGAAEGYLLRSGNGNTFLDFSWTTAPSTYSTKTTNAAMPAGVGWIRATLAVGTGLVSFYTSPDGVTWTPLGSAQSAVGPTQIYAPAAALEIGRDPSSAGREVDGDIYYAEVRNGINGTVVASFSAADNQVQTPWTINGAGWNWEGASFQGKPGIALSLPGTNEYVSTPDTAANSILGDIDLRVKASLASWTPSTNQPLIVKDGGSLAYALWVNSGTGVINFSWSTNGAASSNRGTSVATGFTAGSVNWIRATLVAGTGQVAFFTSTDGVSWAPLGSLPAAAGATSIFDSTAPVYIGRAAGFFAGYLAGTVYYAEVRNGIDGPIVAKFDPTNIIPTGVRLPTSTAQPGGTPNLLTPNQASIEIDASGWTAGTNAPTLAKSTAQFLDGAASLSLTATAAGPANMTADTTPRTLVSVVPGKLYTARGSARAAATPQNTQVYINWWTAGSGYIATSSATLVADTTTGWTETVVTAIAPATAAFATAGMNIAGVVLNEVHYVDRVSLVEASNVWTLNGSAWNWVMAA